jgi:hypothetical protein
MPGGRISLFGLNKQQMIDIRASMVSSLLRRLQSNQNKAELGRTHRLAAQGNVT